MFRVGRVGVLLAWVAVVANCGGGPTEPGPVVSLSVVCPPPVQKASTDGNPVTVSFPTPVAAGGTAPTAVSCSPASGSAFAVGTSDVNCTANDSRGRTASCSFGVTVSLNAPPRITALLVSPNRVEVNGQVQVTVYVQDSETAPSALRYEWTADRAGAFTGQGATVTWNVPDEQATPVDARITVTVVEPLAGGGESRVSRTSDPIHIHNSRAEISSMVMKFLSDFSNSSVSPATCVQNFSDTCEGKQAELADITTNRARYVILSSTFRVETVNVNPPFAWATVNAPCQFTSREIATGAVGTVTGTCVLRTKFLPERWWLCDSNFVSSGTLAPSMRWFFGRPGMLLDGK